MNYEVSCPHCAWRGTAQSERMGTSVKCPACGQVFTLSPVTPASTATGVPKQTRQKISLEKVPKRISELLWADENILFSARPAYSALILSLIFAGIMGSLLGVLVELLLGGVAMSSSPADAVATDMPGVKGIGFFVTLVLFLIVTYYSWKNRYYIITADRTITSQGIFNVGITILFNRHIQLIAINTGIIDRFLGLNSIEISTAAQGGKGGVLAQFPGLLKGSCQFKSVNVKEVIGCYDFLRQG